MSGQRGKVRDTRGGAAGRGGEEKGGGSGAGVATSMALPRVLAVGKKLTGGAHLSCDQEREGGARAGQNGRWAVPARLAWPGGQHLTFLTEMLGVL